MAEYTDEATLIARARRGDLNAFNRLVLAHQALVFDLFAFTEADAQRAETLTEQVFCHAYQQLASYGEGSFRAWLVRLAWRQHGRTSRRAKAMPDVGQTSGRDVAKALAGLPMAERWLLVLADVEGFSYQEIAVVTGLSVHQVARQLAASRHHLAGAL